jgi:hypothetical protein
MTLLLWFVAIVVLLSIAPRATISVLIGAIAVCAVYAVPVIREDARQEAERIKKERDQYSSCSDSDNNVKDPNDPFYGFRLKCE